MADNDKMKDNKDAESGEPVQLDKDQPKPMDKPGQQQGQPQRPPQQPDQEQQGGQQHEGGQKR